MKHSVTLLQTRLHSPQRKAYLHCLNLSDPLLVLVLNWTRPSSNLSLDSDSTYSGLGLHSDPNDLVSTSTLAPSQPPAPLSEASAGAVLSSVMAVRRSPQLSHMHQLLYQTESAVWPISSRAVSPVCYSTLVSLLAATQELILWFLSLSMLLDVLLQGIFWIAGVSHMYYYAVGLHCSLSVSWEFCGWLAGWAHLAFHEFS